MQDFVQHNERYKTYVISIDTYVQVWYICEHRIDQD